MNPQPAWTGSFRREGEYWTIEWEGRVVRVRDVKGLHYIAHLLREPGRSISSTELVGGELRASDASEHERARVNVTRCIRAAQDRIKANHPELAEHLETTLRTGVACSYKPDTRLPVRWTV